MKNLAMFIVAISLLVVPVHSIPVMDLSISILGSDVSIDYFVFDGEIDDYTTSDTGDYEVIIYDNSGKVIFKNKYFFGRITDVTDNYLAQATALSDKIPYNERMKFLRLTHNGQELKTIPLNLCNNDGICGKNENMLTCSTDCTMQGDNLCINKADNICDTDCLNGYDSDCRLNTVNMYWIIVFILIATIGLVLFFHHINIIKESLSKGCRHDNYDNASFIKRRNNILCLMKKCGLIQNPAHTGCSRKRSLKLSGRQCGMKKPATVQSRSCAWDRRIAKSLKKQ